VSQETSPEEGAEVRSVNRTVNGVGYFAVSRSCISCCECVAYEVIWEIDDE